VPDHSETVTLLDCIFEWFSKGVPIWRLQRTDVLGPNSLRRSVAVLTVGIVAAAIIETIVIMLFNPVTSLNQFFGLPLIWLVNATGAAIFLGVFLLLIRLFRLGVTLASLACLTCYTLSGLFPIVALLNAPQLHEAIVLFLKYHDPDLHYLTGATIRLLFSEEATLPAAIRIWCFFVAGLLAFAFYFWMLSRLISRYTNQKHAVKIRVVAAIVIAITAQVTAVDLVLGRIYWLIVGIMLREGK